MNQMEAYLWLVGPPDIEEIERLGLKKHVAEAYDIFLPGPHGLIKVKGSPTNINKFEHLKGLLGESVVSGSYEGQSTEDVKCFARIERLNGYTDPVMRKLSRQDYVRNVSLILGYGGDAVLAELTHLNGLPYTGKDDQRARLEKDISTVTKNFFIVSSLVVRKVI